jgi:hypothetical protein
VTHQIFTKTFLRRNNFYVDAEEEEVANEDDDSEDVLQISDPVEECFNYYEEEDYEGTSNGSSRFPVQYTPASSTDLHVTFEKCRSSASSIQ